MTTVRRRISTVRPCSELQCRRAVCEVDVNYPKSKHDADVDLEHHDHHTQPDDEADSCEVCLVQTRDPRLASVSNGRQRFRASCY